MKMYRFVSSTDENFLENFLTYLPSSNFYLNVNLYDFVTQEVDACKMKLMSTPQPSTEGRYTFEAKLLKSCVRETEVVGCLKSDEHRNVDLVLMDISFSNNFLDFKEIIENPILTKTEFVKKAISYYEKEELEYFPNGNMKKPWQLFRKPGSNSALQITEGAKPLVALTEIYEEIFPIFLIRTEGKEKHISGHYGYGTFITENKIGVMFEADSESIQWFGRKKREFLDR